MRKNVEKTGLFQDDTDRIEAFRYLAQDVIDHPLLLNPKPMTFNITFTGDVATNYGWDTPESASWMQLAMYVRKLALLEKEPVFISNILNVISKDHVAKREAVAVIKASISSWKGSSKTEFFTSNEDGSLSVTSLAGSAEIVINGAMFHADAEKLKIWRGMDGFAKKYSEACTHEYIMSAAASIKSTAELIDEINNESTSEPHG